MDIELLRIMLPYFILMGLYFYHYIVRVISAVNLCQSLHVSRGL